jgi:hypothetical protein
MNRLIAAALSAIFSTAAAPGAVTVIDYYRLGEDDPNPLARSPSRDSSGNPVGANDLPGTVVSDVPGEALGAAYYQSTGNSPAALRLGSTLAMSFETIDGDGTPFQSDQPSTFAATNFGLEGWFKPESLLYDPEMGMVYNGNRISRGFGLFVSGGTYRAHLGGIGFLDSGVRATEEWTYFAIVCQGGVTSLFVNGTTPVASFAVTPIPTAPGDVFVIGSSKRHGESFAMSGRESYYGGEADEIRVFEFQPGAFDARSDLLFAVPEPTASLSLLCGIWMLAGLSRRRRAQGRPPAVRVSFEAQNA